jgi:hypothetical protein
MLACEDSFGTASCAVECQEDVSADEYDGERVIAGFCLGVLLSLAVWVGGALLLLRTIA